MVQSDASKWIWWGSCHVGGTDIRHIVGTTCSQSRVQMLLFKANVFSYCSRFFWHPFIPGLLKVHLFLLVRFGWCCLYSFALCCLYCFGWFCNALHVNRLTFDFIFAYRCLQYMYFLCWFVHFALCIRCFMSWILQGMRMTVNKAFKMFSTTLRILGTKKSWNLQELACGDPLPPQKELKFQEEPRNWGHSKNIHMSQRGTDEIDVCAYVAGCQYHELYSMVKRSYQFQVLDPVDPRNPQGTSQ